MTVLLDTHTLLWATLSTADLSRKAAKLINDEENPILISAATVWEISTKVRLGKLPQAEEFESDLLYYVNEAGYSLLPILAEHALRAGRLPETHRDPFDRILAAQALALDIPILSADAQLDSFHVRRLW